MTEPDSRIDRLVDVLIPALGSGTPQFAEGPVDTSPFVEALRLPNEDDDGGIARSSETPPPAFLADAMKLAAVGPAHVGEIAAAITDLMPSLIWRLRPNPEDPAFMKGHAISVVVGPQGLETRGKAIIGLTVMAANIDYPVHRHPPEELYIALGDGEWWQEDAGWRRPGIGGLVYNPSNVLHTIRTGDAPTVMIWCLWR